MENQEPKKAPEITADAPGKDRAAEVKSDASSHENVEVENKGTKSDTDYNSRSPGKTDR